MDKLITVRIKDESECMRAGIPVEINTELQALTNTKGEVQWVLNKDRFRIISITINQTEVWQGYLYDFPTEGLDVVVSPSGYFKSVKTRKEHAA